MASNFALAIKNRSTVYSWDADDKISDNLSGDNKRELNCPLDVTSKPFINLPNSYSAEFKYNSVSLISDEIFMWYCKVLLTPSTSDHKLILTLEFVLLRL